MISNTYLNNFDIFILEEYVRYVSYLNPFRSDFTLLTLEAVGGSDDILGGHQSASTKSLQSGIDIRYETRNQNHPGIFVYLKWENYGQHQETGSIICRKVWGLTGLTGLPPTILFVFSMPHLQAKKKNFLVRIKLNGYTMFLKNKNRKTKSEKKAQSWYKTKFCWEASGLTENFLRNHNIFC